ncbi:hypothetical protein CVT24_003352 [Panaeolus cyanescens]|uniref:Transmembrane protein n=1 Tax=Panaeolus cyanescens TaxID=181874 RepID=A0A409Y716_9AGAR|nr:hypothetical protein CVT24_003352 [Panaeolus cyanescens]
MISYAPAGSWNDTPSDDTLAVSYSGSSYHTASAQGATATFTFNGSGFTIFGGRRPNYGTYSISVDGQVVHTGSSQSPDPSFQQTLASVNGLSDGLHTVVLTNTGSGSIDIDWIEFESRVGAAGATMLQKTFDDNDATIKYLPSSSSWQTNTGNSFMGGTLHFSNDVAASASLSFSGDAIAVYGTTAPDHANIRVNIDGISQVMAGGAQGKVDSLHTKILLFYINELGGGQHTLTLSGDAQANTGPFIDIDSISVFEAVNPIGSSSTVSGQAAGTGSVLGAGDSVPTNTLSQASSQSTKIPTRTIVGGVVGGILGLIVILGIVGMMVIRKRRGKAKRIEKSMISVSPVLPMQWEPKTLEAGLATPLSVSDGESAAFPLPPPKSQKVRASLRHSIAPSYYSDPAYQGHSRDGSVMSSSSQSVVPLLSSPRLPTHQQQRMLPRKPPPILLDKVPTRPSNRPPSMDFL